MHKRIGLPLTLIILLSLVLSGCEAAETLSPKPAGTLTNAATQTATTLQVAIEAPFISPEIILFIDPTEKACLLTSADYY